MLILSPYQNKVLMPVRQSEWRAPSLAQPKDQFGNENQTRFRLRARLQDGAVKWVGWFDDREDADAFLWGMALYANGMPFPVENFHLFNEVWGDPSFEPWLSYDFATLAFLVTPTGSNQSYTSPSDWNNSNNQIETVGAGGSGGSACSSSAGPTRNGGGGGGGAWNKITNFTFATPGTTTATYQLGTGGVAKTTSGTTVTSGSAGGDTWFGGTTLGGSSVGSKGGGLGTASTGTGGTGGAGGVGASGVGTSSHDGGAGGTASASGVAACGGGGAAGGSGNGSTAANNSTVDTSTAGATGDAGSGGSAGTLGGGTGGNGSEWDASHGSGGGGGGAEQHAAGAGTAVGGTGGNYGAGGGGVACRNITSGSIVSGAGNGGIVALTYTPSTAGIGLIPMSMGSLMGRW